jgi:hypothetical protein
VCHATNELAFPAFLAPLKEVEWLFTPRSRFAAPEPVLVFTGMYPLRTGMIPPQLPGSPSYLRPGIPALAKFLLDLATPFVSVFAAVHEFGLRT